MSETIREIYDRFNSDGGPLDQIQQQYVIFNGNGQSDFNATAHAYTSAGIAYHHGEFWANVYGEGREAQTRVSVLFEEGRLLTENEQRDGLRDVFNNRVGIEIAQYARDNGLSEAVMADLVGDALARGLLVVNEFNDSRITDPSLGTHLGIEAAVYDGPSADAARALELKYGLPTGSLSTGSATGEGARTYFDAPLTSPHPNPRPDMITEAGQMNALIDANPELLLVDGFISYLRETFDPDLLDQILDQCFGPEVPIDMWPLDPDLKPGPDGIFDQEAVRAKVWKKPIELIRVGDIVVSFDENDNLVPGPVTRTFENNAKILLNFHGTRVTPGHVYYRPDSKKSFKYETLIDVLRDDGMIKHQDGTLIRAATNVPVDSPRDGFVRAIAGTRKADGTFEQTDEGRIRLGTRFLVGTGKERKSFAVADLIEHDGGVVGDDELIRVGEGPAMPFLWDFGDTVPKPEDFVLACSGTTLEEIYKAAEWESQGPRLAAPMVLDRGPVQPLKGAALSAMPRNEPLDVAHAPMAAAKPQRTLNRKQRKAMEAKQRKAAKSGKRIAG